MENTSEGSGIYLGTDLSGCTQGRYVVIIELQPAIQISIQGGRGKYGFRIDAAVERFLQAAHNLRRFRHGDGLNGTGRLPGFQVLLNYFMGRLQQELKHETGLLATVKTVR